MDSSFAERSHAYFDRRDEEIPIFCAGRWFKSEGRLVKQVLDFQEFCLRWHAVFLLHAHGDGLLQHWHRAQFPGFYNDDVAKGETRREN